MNVAVIVSSCKGQKRSKKTCALRLGLVFVIGRGGVYPEIRNVRWHYLPQSKMKFLHVRGRETPFLNAQWESGLVKGLISRKMNPRLSSGFVNRLNRDMPLHNTALG